MDKDLLIRYLDGTLDKEETARLVAWVQESPENAQSLFELKETFLSMNYDSSRELPWMEQEWKQIQARTSMGKKPLHKAWRHIAAAVACLLMIAGLLWRHFSPNAGPQAEAPVIIQTGFGQRAESILPDGSVICLNSCSRISYDPLSWNKKRSVTLQGEASFDVVHNEESPFSVHADGFSVSVLGTSFDVSDYPEDREASVSLKSGKVHINIAGANIDLNPGKTLRLDRDDSSWTINDTQNNDLSWERETYIFENEPLEKMRNLLQRHFGYTFDIAPDCLNQSYRAILEQESLTEFLDMLAAVTPDMHYSIDHGTKTVRIFKK